MPALVDSLHLVRCGPEPTEIRLEVDRSSESAHRHQDRENQFDRMFPGAKESMHFALGPAALGLVTGVTGSR